MVFGPDLERRRADCELQIFRRNELEHAFIAADRRGRAKFIAVAYPTACKNRARGSIIYTAV